jgi:hypothetical protein
MRRFTVTSANWLPRLAAVGWRAIADPDGGIWMLDNLKR